MPDVEQRVNPTQVSIDLVVRRANGAVENLGVQSYVHRSRQRTAAVAKLIARREVLLAEELMKAPTWRLVLRAALPKKEK